MDLKIGDKVRFDGKGQVMTVDEIDETTNKAKCVWTEDGGNKVEYYSIRNLETYDEETENEEVDEFIKLVGSLNRHPLAD